MQNPSGDQESGAVGGGIVGEADLDAVFGQLVSVSRFHDNVTVNARVRNLAHDVLVRETDDQSVENRERMLANR